MKFCNYVKSNDVNDVLTESDVRSHLYSQQDLGVYINPENKGITSDLILTITKDVPSDLNFSISMRYYQWVYAIRTYLNKSLLYIRILNPNASKELTNYMFSVESEIFKRSKLMTLMVPDMLAIPKKLEFTGISATIGGVSSEKFDLQNAKTSSDEAGLNWGISGKAESKRWVAFFARAITIIKLIGSQYNDINEAFDNAIDLLNSIAINDAKGASENYNFFKHNFVKNAKHSQSYLSSMIKKIRNIFTKKKMKTDSKLFKISSANTTDKFRTVLFIDDEVLEKNPELFDKIMNIINTNNWNTIINKTGMFFDIVLASEKKDLILVCFSEKYNPEKSVVTYLSDNVPLMTTYTTAKTLFGDPDDLSGYEKMIEYIHKNTKPINTDLVKSIGQMMR